MNDETTGLSPHPDDETLAAYLDATLAKPDRARLEEHLSVCDECRAVVSETARFAAAEAGARDEPVARRRPALAWAIAAAAAVVAGVALLRGGAFVPRPRGPMAELVSALEGERPIEPRLAGGFKYAPPKDVTRGDAPGATPSWKVLAAAAKVKEEADRSSTPDALSAVGVAHLVLGEEDAAVSALEKALKARPKDAALLTDLSAAYLVRARRKDEAEDIIRALDTADRAIEADAKLAEPHFNRALALEALGRGEMAKKAWDDYLARDAGSEWAAEAKRRRDAIAPARNGRLSREEQVRIANAARRGDVARLRAVVASAPSACFEHAEDLLVEWATARNDGRDGAAPFEAVEALARALAEETGDTLALDSVQAVRRAGGAADELARAHVLFARARRLYGTLEIADATATAAEAERVFERLQSPYALWARLQRAISLYYTRDLDAASLELDRLRQDVAEESSPRLAARVHWMRGLLFGMRELHADALMSYSKAGALYRQAHDSKGALAVDSILASAYQLVGDTRSEWRHQVRALRALELQDPVRRPVVLLDAGASARDQGWLHAAVELSSEAVRLATTTPHDHATALVRRAECRRGVGNELGARRDLDEARSLLASVTDRAIAERDEGLVLLAQAALDADGRSGHALSLLDHSVQIFRAHKSPFWLQSALLARGRAALRSANASAAERDFEEAIATVEERRPAQREWAVSFFGRSMDAYEEMVALQASYRKKPDAALDYLERARARDLLSTLDAAARPLRSEELRERLPEGTALVYFDAQNDRFLSWAVRRRDIRYNERRLSAAALTQMVEEFRAALASDQGTREAGAVLYDQILAPLEDALAGAERLVFVMDGPLHTVPFAALWDRARGRFLVEEKDISVAPSGTVFVKALERARTLGHEPAASVVVFGNGAKPPKPFDGLDRLPQAEVEAREVASVHAASTLLVGLDATARRFLELGPTARIVHFAGHALANERDPAFSALLMASDPQTHDSGALFARRISSVNWRSTELVVLGGCGTATGSAFRGEGVLSLARPFLAAGVPAIVATVSAVSDDRTRALLTVFHAALARRENACHALRQAQLALLRNPDERFRQPSGWASFIFIGATSA